MKSIGTLLEATLEHFEKREYGDAKELVDALLAANPDFHRGWFLKGVILEETGRQDDAQACFDKAGNVYHMWFRLALQIQEKDPEKALRYYDRVLQGDDQNNMTLLNKGLIYEKMGKADEARSCFRRMAPSREIFSNVLIPLGFMIFLVSAGIVMVQRGEKGLSVLVLLSAVFCLFWLKRDAGTALRMFLKKHR